MRTTMILEDRLLVRAKQLAAASHRSLSAIVNDLLRQYVEQAETKPKPVRFKMLVYGNPSDKPIPLDPARFSEAEDDVEIWAGRI